LLPALRIESAAISNPLTPAAALDAEGGRGFGGSGAFPFPPPTGKATNPEDESGIEFRKFIILNYL
jgi:hypothetical protein